MLNPVNIIRQNFSYALSAYRHVCRIVQCSWILFENKVNSTCLI